MKKIGIIGGMGPESTVDYYKGIMQAFYHRGDTTCPEIILYSVNMYEMLKMVEEKRWDDLTEWLLGKMDALMSAGAEFAVIGANTPHVVFDDVAVRSPLPLVSIVEETYRTAEQMAVKRPGLMGTLFTMQSDFFRKPFSRGDMAIVVPDQEDRDYIHHKLFSEIELGIIKDSTRRDLLNIVKKMIDTRSIDSLILGCTELPMILDRDEYGIPFFNTTAIHIESIVRHCLAG
jgi:aspartate racemase